MASNKLSTTAILLSLFFFLTFAAAGIPCNQPKTKPTIPKTKPAIPKTKPAIPKIITPPSTTSPAVSSTRCPKDTVKLGVCSDILGIGTLFGSPVSSKCCSLIAGLTDGEAAACLCTAIKANVLGIALNIPVSFSFLVSTCKKSVPAGYQCK